mmetsp:Transcript_10860/g.14121  ORF Transcript_10860/g.14121 Transcript_10860/m.14121 type:complete len:204 (+) Transcript_10860:95-706(+)
MEGSKSANQNLPICAYDGCCETPTYGYPDQKVPLVCKDHTLEGMELVYGTKIIIKEFSQTHISKERKEGGLTPTFGDDKLYGDIIWDLQEKSEFESLMQDSHAGNELQEDIMISPDFPSLCHDLLSSSSSENLIHPDWNASDLLPSCHPKLKHQQPKSTLGKEQNHQSTADVMASKDQTAVAQWKLDAVLNRMMVAFTHRSDS